jgi:hypothetical protein
MKANSVSGFDVDMKYGTVGAVALDANGHVAAATSTGGVTGKRWGRIGDSPLIGAGDLCRRPRRRGVRHRRGRGVHSRRRRARDLHANAAGRRGVTRFRTSWTKSERSAAPAA